jgi:valyl-tRNA synthetase
METRFSPADIEDKWYSHWESKGYFNSKPDHREAYTIVIPPPNVTGVLHMGHLLNNTIQDILIRKARMEGKNACWVPGTDHASIATEAKVVRWLREEKKLRKADITREEFMGYAYQWKDKYGGIILQQLRKLGASCDWNRTSFTMDETYYRDVIRVFVDLYGKGKLYRGQRMVNWDPEAKTVLSNEEVIHHEEQARLYHLRYTLEGNENESIVIATQRPETIFADVAVAVHPKDPRYKQFKGKRVRIPLTDRYIPVIFDTYVDQEFGTGALKITPAHDPNDYEIGTKHGLEVIDTIDDDGKMNSVCSYQPIVGLDRFDARKKIGIDLEASGHLVRTEDYITKIGRSERTNCVVEPKLSLQWFVRMSEFKEPALKAVQKNEVYFMPQNMKNTYRHWMTNLRDWCISRQLWWGQRIPAWYLKTDARGQEKYVFVGRTAEDALTDARKQMKNPQLTIDDLRQDEDVLDTWASSWLWPISVFDGFEKPNGDFAYYYPTQVVVTGWDIMFFWIARMIMAGYEFTGKRPFEHVYFTGMVRDKQRRKMSKSLGNSPDALELLAEFGADGVRYGLLSSSPAGGDLLFDEKLCETGRNFCNKLWNACRLVKGWEVSAKPESKQSAEVNALAVKWINHKLKATLTDFDKNFKAYRLSDALLSLYSFIWDDFCSWYLEMIKPTYGLPIDQKTLSATIEVFSSIMAALHPFMPFVTEEIWHQLSERAPGQDCTMSRFPKKGKSDAELLRSVATICQVISAIRDERQRSRIRPRDPLNITIQNSPTAEALYADIALRSMVIKMANLSQFELIEKEPPSSKTVMVGTEKYYIESSVEIDVAEETATLNLELSRQQGFVQSVEAKLSNERFVAGAPPQVIENERRKLADGQERIKMILESLAKLKE